METPVDPAEQPIHLTKITIAANCNGFPNQIDYQFQRPFTIITGVNGVGKTQFLESISQEARKLFSTYDSVVSTGISLEFEDNSNVSVKDKVTYQFLSLNCQMYTNQNNVNLQSTHTDQIIKEKAKKIELCAPFSSSHNMWERYFADATQRGEAQEILQDVMKLQEDQSIDNLFSDFLFNELQKRCKFLGGENLDTARLLN